LGLHSEDWSAVVLDLYDAAAAQLCELAHSLPTASIAESRHCPGVGIVVDYHLDRAGEESSARLLAGPRYAPIDPHFAALGSPGEVVASALVTVGGAQRAGELLPALIGELERAFPGVLVRLAGGGVDPRPARSSLIDIVPNIDIAVSAAGFTAYELACAGIPGVVVALAENQRRVARACEHAGVALGIDALDGSLADLGPALRRLRDACLRSRMSRAGRTAFDGRGAARAALALEQRWGLDRPSPRARRAGHASLCLRAARADDAKRLLVWRNDPVTRRFSFDHGEVSRASHMEWLAQRLDDSSGALWIAESDGEPVGQVRADVLGPELVEIHITVAPAARGQRLAARMIAQASERIDRELCANVILARVLACNEASLAAFRRAGFDERERHAHEVVLERRLTPPG
jgi:RimJ/RimL family protein N-acetyltransferase